MKLKPSSLNIKLPPPTLTWRLQWLFILVSALLSLYVIWPSSLVNAVCAVLVGTPLFWFIFGSNIIFRFTSGMPLLRFAIIIITFYVFAKFLVVAVKWLSVLLSTYGIT